MDYLPCQGISLKERKTYLIVFLTAKDYERKSCPERILRQVPTHYFEQSLLDSEVLLIWNLSYNSKKGSSSLAWIVSNLKFTIGGYSTEIQARFLNIRRKRASKLSPLRKWNCLDCWLCTGRASCTREWPYDKKSGGTIIILYFAKYGTYTLRKLRKYP